MSTFTAPPRAAMTADAMAGQNRDDRRSLNACLAFLVVVPVTLVAGLVSADSSTGGPIGDPLSCVARGYPTNIDRCPTSQR